MVTAILILLYSARRGILIDSLKKPLNTHSQKLCIGIGQKYHPEWYFLMRPTRMIIKTDSPGNVAIHHMTPQDFQFFLSRPLMPLLFGQATA
jgi:hypothetical protein